MQDTSPNLAYKGAMNTITIPKKYSGKWFSPDDILLINQLIANNPQASRAALSRLVCQQFDWHKQDGGLKEMSCRVAMLRMLDDNIISLPKPRVNKLPCHHFKKRTDAAEPGQPLNCAITELSGLNIDLVNRNNSALWNELIDRYHYLGYKPMPGAQLRYFVSNGDHPIALLSFGASAWKTAPRDRYIGWHDEQRKSNLHLIVNNARFLILPWIRVPHLGSKLLSMCAKRLPNDWVSRYHYRPVLLETFVQQDRFKGTCYKASNWEMLGTTTGRGKIGTNRATLPVKTVWVYPLNKHFKKILCV